MAAITNAETNFLVTLCMMILSFQLADTNLPMSFAIYCNPVANTYAPPFEGPPRTAPP
jgi:hypothetical protein